MMKRKFYIYKSYSKWGVTPWGKMTIDIKFDEERKGKEIDLREEGRKLGRLLSTKTSGAFEEGLLDGLYTKRCKKCK